MTRKATPGPPTGITPAQAIAGGGLLGDAFLGSSWDRWRAILKAAWAEPMTPHEIALFREVAARDPPTQRVRELWIIAGRGAGKDAVASGIACVAALQDYRKFLRPGEMATILCLASDRAQAAIAKQYTTQYFSDLPELRPLITKEMADGLELANGVSISVGTNNHRSVRGRRVVCAILDECAFFRTDDAAASDYELYAALRPSLARTPGSLLIGISSPYKRGGLLYERWQRHYGKDVGDVLVVRGTTLQFNPTFDKRTIDEDLERDPERFSAEYLAAWRDDLSDFLTRDLVESAVERGVRVRPPRHDADYRAFVDSSGGRGDAFTAAVAHAEGDVVVIDAVYERKAPFSPPEVVKEVCDLVRSYRVSRVTGDRYAADWVTSAFAEEGLAYETSTRDRSMVYLDVLPLFASGRLRLPDHPRMVHQFVSLERRISRFGKDGVNHPDGGSDDLANACAGAAVLASLDKRPALVRIADTLHDGAPLDVPTSCAGMTVTIATAKSGAVAVIYAALSDRGVVLADGRAGHQMFILDYEVGPLRASFFADLRVRATELAGHCCTAPWSTLQGWIDPAMYPAARAARYGAAVVPAPVAAGVDLLLAPVALAIALGQVKVCQPAHERSKTSPWGGVLDFRAGDGGEDALRKAAAWSIALTLNLRI